jgi:ubiquinol-cytochrome c reductase cytochrome c1 subunit
MRINKLILLLLALVPAVSLAATEGVKLEHAGTDIHNQASLQRGARNFVNYCMGCHSAQYVRWNRIGADLGLSDDELKKSLMFAGGPVFGTIKSAMPKEDAVRWFGVAPPDLSLIARSRGLDYLYTFLKGFYEDPSRPAGVNNRVLANTAMPHVLAPLQGVQKPKFELVSHEGKTEKVLVGLEPGTPGQMSAEQYDEFVRDTVNFLDYMGEPAKAQRQSLGIWVTLFLLVFWLFAYLLKKEYWKDVK